MVFLLINGPNSLIRRKAKLKHSLKSEMKLDALNFTLPLDNELTELLKDLQPHKSCFELDEPKTISGNLSVPKTVVATISNWMHSSHNEDQAMDADFLNSVEVV